MTTTVPRYRSLRLFVAILTLASVGAIPAAAADPPFDGADAGLLEFSAAAYGAGEADASDTIAVRRFGNTGGTVTVDYATVDGTGVAGSDYTATSGTLTFAPGDTSESFTVPILEDATIEGDEAFSFVLSNPTGGGVLSDQVTTIVTITDNDDNPGWLEFSAAAYGAGEADASDTIAVRRFGGSGGTVTVDYATVDGTGVAGSDYTATSGTLTFVPGDTSESFTVPILEDATIEGDEAFSFVLSNPTGGGVLSDQVTTIVTITDNDDNPGWLEFSAAAYGAGEADASDTIAVRRFGGSGGTVTVDYATVDGTGVAGSDYTATSGTLTFVPGDTSESFTVPILEDATIEGDEAFSFVLSNPTGGGVLSDQVTTIVTITDNDDNPGWLEFSAAAYGAGEADASDTIAVRRFGGSGGTVTVDYATVDGTGVAGSDYTATSGTLTFAPGDTSESFTVPILEDATIEGDEAFSFVLSNPTGGGVLSDQVTTIVTITDNDDNPGWLEFSAPLNSASEAVFSETIAVRRFGGSGGTVTVDYATVDGTGVAGSDYTATSGTLTFVPGDTSETITVPILEDALIEGTEAFSIVLSNPTGGGVLSDQVTTVVTITDNDLFAGDLSVSGAAEPENGVTEEVRITRAGDGVGAVSVDFAVVDLTATNGADYTMVSGTVTFSDGETGSKYVSFTPIDDALLEGTEYFQVVLSNPTGGATLDDTRMAVGTISDDEKPVGYFRVTGVSEPENGVIEDFRVYRDEGTAGAVSVDYTVVDLTATNGADYTMVSGTVTFSDGESGSKSVTFTPIDDALVEGTEYFQVVLSNPTGGATLHQNRIARATISDDEKPVGYFRVTGVSEPENGVIEDFRVYRDEGTAGAVSVDYTVVDLTATNGADYTMVSGTVTFSDGESGSKSVTFTPIDDALVEGTEYFQVVLSNPTGGATLHQNRIARATISDDEKPVGYFRVGGVSEPENGVSEDFRVYRDEGAGGAVSVDYTVVDLTATNGADYTMVSGTVTFSDGESSSKSVTFTPIDDALVEGTEYFQVVLSNPTGGATLHQNRIARATISDDEKPVGYFRVGGVSEPENGVSEDFRVYRDEGAGGAVSVDYTVVDLTATNGADYTMVSGTVTFSDGESSSKSVTFTPIDDALVEGTEYFQVVLSNPTGGATLHQNRIARATITDDEIGKPGEFSLASDSSSADENAGPVEFTVLRVAGSTGAASVDYATAPVSATPDVDYTPVSGTLVWLDGDFSERIVSVPLLDDADVEDDETLTVTLSNFTGASAGAIASATGTIINDDSSSPPVGAVDFSSHSVVSYGGSQDAGSYTVSGGGFSLTLLGNAWKKIVLPTVVAAGTVLEFDYSSSVGGEIQGIGFDTDETLSPDRTFELFGSQVWGIQDYATYVSPGVVHYTIPVGTFYTGSFDFLFFVNDDDASSAADGTFTNVVIAQPAPPAGAVDFSGYAVESYSAQDAGSAVVLDDGASLRLEGNAWKKITLPMTVTAGTVLEFDYSSSVRGEIQGIGFDTDDFISSDRTFELFGSQVWGIQDYATYVSPGVVHYTIPVGTFYTGSFDFLFFVNDDDASSAAEGTFTNVVIAQPAPPAGAVDFSGYAVESYSAQDAGSAVVLDDGASLRLEGNAWKKITLPMTVTAGTVLEFDYSSSVRGEIQGIGFDTDDFISSDRTFQLFGTQVWGIQDYATYVSPGVTHYTIPVGTFYTGSFDFLVFVNDHDSAATADGTFTNVVITQPAPPAGAVDFSSHAVESYGAGQDAGSAVVSGDGYSLTLVGNAWKKITLSTTVTAGSVLEFDYSSTTRGEIQGIGFDTDDFISSDRTFQLFGTQVWGIQDYATYVSPGVVHYTIPVGTFYTGSFDYLVFVNDHDGGGTAVGTYTNVVITTS